MRCEICDTEIPAGATECPHCGFEVEWMRREISANDESNYESSPSDISAKRCEPRAAEGTRRHAPITTASNLNRSQSRSVRPRKKGKHIVPILASLIILIAALSAGLFIYTRTQNPITKSNPVELHSQDTTLKSEQSSWELSGFVDDFGDSTGEMYLQGTFLGTFSNTATSGEAVRIVLGFIPSTGNSVPILIIRLVEYNNTLDIKATYSESDEKIIKVKIGDKVLEDVLDGNPPNGDLMLISGQCLMEIYDAFQDENQDIKFVIELGSAKYSFTADGNGFPSCWDEYWSLNPDKTDGRFYKGTNFLKLENFLTGRRNGLVMIPKQYTGTKDYLFLMTCNEEEFEDGSILYEYKFFKVSPKDNKDLRNFGFEKYLSEHYSSFEKTGEYKYWDDYVCYDAMQNELTCSAQAFESEEEDFSYMIGISWNNG